MYNILKSYLFFKCTCKKKQINIAHQKFHPKFDNQKPKTIFNIFYKNVINFPTKIVANPRLVGNHKTKSIKTGNLTHESQTHLLGTRH